MYNRKSVLSGRPGFLFRILACFFNVLNGGSFSKYIMHVGWVQ